MLQAVAPSSDVRVHNIGEISQVRIEERKEWLQQLVRYTIVIIKPWRACARGLRYLVCVSVCLSVCLSVSTIFLETVGLYVTAKVPTASSRHALAQ